MSQHAGSLSKCDLFVTDSVHSCCPLGLSWHLFFKKSLVPSCKACGICRERKKERDAELRQVLEGQTARMVELLDNHQKLQVSLLHCNGCHAASAIIYTCIQGLLHFVGILLACIPQECCLLANTVVSVLQARVKELEHQLREKQVENVYLRGEISGLKNNNSQHLQNHVLHDDRDSK